MQAILMIVLGVLLGIQGVNLDKKIASELQKELKAKQVTVKIEGSRLKLISSGKIKKVSLAVFGFCNADLCLDRYDVAINGIKLSRGDLMKKKLKVKSVDGVDWDVSVKQEELQRYLGSRADELKDCEIIMDNNSFKIRVPVFIKIIRKKSKVEFTGQLEENQGGIGVRITQINTFGLKISTHFLDYITDMFNPVVSEEALNKKIAEKSPYRDPSIKYTLHIKDIVEKPSLLEIHGTADVVVLSEAAK